MKRNALALVLIVIIVFSIAAWFVHSQISELENQIAALKAQKGEVQDQLGELQNQLSELQLQNREQQDRLGDFTYELAKARHVKVEISEFQWIGGFNPVGGLLIGHPVNITIQNNDVVPLSGLRLRVSLVRENTGAEISYAGGVTLERLNAGESRVIRSEPWTSLSANLNNTMCMVTLSVGDIVLDNVTYNIS
jgi:uncharacterized coiled-coil protein SlyX